MLTKSEKQVMELLWNSEEPLSCVEIVEQSGDKTWKDSYIHIMVRSLLKKEMIKVGGVELVAKNYARKFAPNLTKEEYAVKSLIYDKIWSKDSAPQVLKSYICNEASIESLKEIDQLVKEQLEKNQ